MGSRPAVAGSAGGSGGAGQAGSAVVEFVLVGLLAVVAALAVAQLGLFLWERNAVMGSLAEGARVAATHGRGVDDGERVAATLVRQALGGRVAAAVRIRGGVDGDRVVFRAVGILPSFLPGVPGLPVRMRATMHEEERLCAGGCLPGPAGR
ncbi:MAG TPA: TadE/TadG family type IV pilus assembly protein [Actinomycetes bacterium]|nr:TadE/TadG family type IV pilus assembly protein [Actinomycetes bacterium]